jgi:hypothetical protein
MYIWHKVQDGIPDQYFVCYNGNVLFKIPKFIGKLFKK